MEHQRIPQGGAGAAIRRRRPGRSRLWLLAAGGCVPLLAVAVLLRSPGPERTVRTASESGVASAAGLSGGPAGPMTAGPGSPMTGGSAGSGGSGEPAGAAGGQVIGNSANATAATSQNWAGYAAASTPGTFTSVSSSWTEPAVTCTAQQTFSSFWVGLDGDGTQTVEQTGTEADCNNGAASYQGWFEMFPNAPVFYNSPVAAGDAMSASVVANGGGAFTLTLSDQTQGWTQTTNQTSATAQLGSAEIIAEAPSDAATVLPLSSFGTVNFTNALVNNAALANANAAELTMVSAAGVTEATPSALTNGDSFSVTWDSNGTSVGAVPAPSTSASPAPSTSASPAPSTSASPAPGVSSITGP